MAAHTAPSIAAISSSVSLAKSFASALLNTRHPKSENF
jgi:hypothetical protein